MPYVIRNVFVHGANGYPWQVVIVGAGGTGSFAAEGLARLLPQTAEMVLVDMDRVEEQNVHRQNFLSREVGELKSAALAKRLSEKYDRPVGYSTLPIEMTGLKTRGLLLGCVDNGIARANIASRQREFFWWVDAGNGWNFGQILIGNSDRAVFSEKEQKIDYLPLPSIQRPEILIQPPAPAPNCAQLPDQGPTINQVMAVAMVEVVRRIIEGTCSWMQLMIDMEHGTMSTVPATPEMCREIMHTRSKKKVYVTKGG